MDEPIADTARGILDGHIILSRDIAARNHFPSIDVNVSVSRLFTNVNSPEHIKAAGLLREVLARYTEAEDLINIGAYVRGSNPKIDWAIEKIDKVNNFLRQGTHEFTAYKETVQHLTEMMGAGYGGGGGFQSQPISTSTTADTDNLFGEDLDLDNLNFDEF
jgi:flagellum-specific ATP synthase